MCISSGTGLWRQTSAQKLKAGKEEEEKEEDGGRAHTFVLTHIFAAPDPISALPPQSLSRSETVMSGFSSCFPWGERGGDLRSNH